MKTAYLMKR